MSADWRRKLLVCELTADGEVTVEEREQPSMREDLLALFDRAELSKYLTAEEMAEYDALVKES
jgi:succinate dehydrogenase / fumarate reductase flavoprotein subunit